MKTVPFIDLTNTPRSNRLEIIRSFAVKFRSNCVVTTTKPNIWYFEEDTEFNVTREDHDNMIANTGIEEKETFVELFLEPTVNLKYIYSL